MMKYVIELNEAERNCLGWLLSQDATRAPVSMSVPFATFLTKWNQMKPIEEETPEPDPPGDEKDPEAPPAKLEAVPKPAKEKKQPKAVNG